MTSQNRNERELMRQRGAGNHNVAPTNFGLTFGFDRGRQDRQQMRQRGAASRKVDSIDFGLNFPTPGLRRSRSATPASRASNASRVSKITTRRSRESSIGRVRRSVSATPAVEGSNPGKRRKVNFGTELHRDGTLSAAARRRQTSSVFPIVEDAEEGLLAPVPEVRHVVSPVPEAASPLFVPQDESEKENASPIEAQPLKKRRKKKSIIPASLRRKKRSSGASTNPDLRSSVMRQDPVQSEMRQPNQTREGHGRGRSPSLGGSIDSVDVARESSLIPSEGSPVSMEGFTIEKTDGLSKEQEARLTSKKPPKRRKKRKSVILVKPRKRRSNEGAAKSVSAGPSRMRTQSPPLAPSEERPASDHSSEEEEDIRPRRAVPTRPRQDTIRSLGTSPLMRRDAEEGSEEEYNPNDYSPEPETPAPNKKGHNGKQLAQPRPRSDDGSERPPKKRKKETFPIITHRMTNAGALPTIEEEGEADQYDEDHQPLPESTFTDRPTPNSIDVLAQICREVVDSAIERLPQIQERAVDRKRKHSALESFGNDLGTRLFDMSNAVENRMALEARVRKARREKSDLQVQWVEVRRQRERMALKCDRVRKYHWDNETDREDKWQISEAAHKAELELGRGEAEEEESLEFLLKTVAEDVSGKGQAGLLGRIKAFNGQLERMAGVLESRV